jgi:hypothetical protein
MGIIKNQPKTPRPSKNPPPPCPYGTCTNSKKQDTNSSPSAESHRGLLTLGQHFAHVAAHANSQKRSGSLLTAKCSSVIVQSATVSSESTDNYCSESNENKENAMGYAPTEKSRMNRYLDLAKGKYRQKLFGGIEKVEKVERAPQRLFGTKQVGGGYHDSKLVGQGPGLPKESKTIDEWDLYKKKKDGGPPDVGSDFTKTTAELCKDKIKTNKPQVPYWKEIGPYYKYNSDDMDRRIMEEMKVYWTGCKFGLHHWRDLYTVSENKIQAEQATKVFGRKIDQEPGGKMLAKRVCTCGKIDDQPAKAREKFLIKFKKMKGNL